MGTSKTSKITVSVETRVESLLRDIATKNDFTLNDLCSAVLSLWVTHGGSIWMGRKWCAVDWPKKFIYLERNNVNHGGVS